MDVLSVIKVENTKSPFSGQKDVWDVHVDFHTWVGAVAELGRETAWSLSRFSACAWKEQPCRHHCSSKAGMQVVTRGGNFTLLDHLVALQNLPTGTKTGCSDKDFQQCSSV